MREKTSRNSLTFCDENPTLVKNRYSPPQKKTSSLCVCYPCIITCEREKCSQKTHNAAASSPKCTIRPTSAATITIPSPHHTYYILYSRTCF